MIRAIAVDDEPLALTILKSHCNTSPSVQLVETFTDAAAAQQWLAQHEVDLLFLDVQMPGLNGIDLYKSLPEKIPVVFTTAFAGYAVEGFNVNAVDYLLKPISFSRFQQAIDKVMAARGGHEAPPIEGSLLVRADYADHKVPLEDIAYIEGLDNYMKIHRRSSTPLVVRMSMASALERLPTEHFMRIHRSYIVRPALITAIRGKMAVVGKVELPIGAQYAADLLAAWKG